MRSILSFFKSLLVFIKSYYYFKTKNKYSTSGYFSMLNLFCKTGGVSNDLVSKLISLGYREKSRSSTSTHFGKYSNDKINQITEDIRENGFHVLDKKLDEETLKYFLDYSKNTIPNVRLMDEEVKLGKHSKGKVKFDENNLVALRYDYMEEELVNDAMVQELIGDPVLTAIAERYLKAEPLVDITTLWWHTDYSQLADDNAAMMYHFDMDRIKWLKVFFYITDVGPENGPHCFVKKSHKTRGIPFNFLKKGYVRLSDEEVESHYGKENIVEFIGSKGTIILEDTRGLHKGKHVEKGARLIFQIEYTNSLFGSAKPVNQIKNISSEVLMETNSTYKKLLNWYGK